MNGNINHTTESLKVEANGIMSNMNFPNNVSPRKKPFYAQQQLIIADDKFKKLKFGHFCKYFGIKYDTALRRKRAMETHRIVKKGRQFSLSPEDNLSLREWVIANIMAKLLQDFPMTEQISLLDIMPMFNT